MMEGANSDLYVGANGVIFSGDAGCKAHVFMFWWGC